MRVSTIGAYLLAIASSTGAVMVGAEEKHSTILLKDVQEDKREETQRELHRLFQEEQRRLLVESSSSPASHGSHGMILSSSCWPSCPRKEKEREEWYFLRLFLKLPLKERGFVQEQEDGYRFREDKDLFLAPTTCGGECLEENGFQTPFLSIWDAGNDSQRWEITPFGDGKSIGHNIKANSGGCIGITDCNGCDYIEMLSCDDPRTQMVWVDVAFNSWYCWLQEGKRYPKSIDFDNCANYYDPNTEESQPYWNDDEFYYNNLYFLDECAVPSVPDPTVNKNTHQ